MTTLQMFDRVPVGAVRFTDDGYLVTDARVARTGIQEYLGSELGRPEPIIRVYRPESAVFAQDAMRTYAHKPVTNNHPGESVSAKNWKDFAIGQLGAEVVRDGEFVRVPLVLMDAAAIDDYKAGKRELSMGYDANVEFVDGVTPDGQPYNAVISEMRMNHLALVDRARGGESLRIGDKRTPGAANGAQPKGGHPMAGETKTVLVDGFTVETTLQGAEAIQKLQNQLKDSAANTKMMTDAHAAEVAKLQADLGARDAEIATLKAAALTDAQIEARAAARAVLLADAKKLHDADYTGKSDAEVRALAVSHKMGDASVAGKSADYVQAAFDMLVKDAKPADPLAQHVRDNAGNNTPNPQDNGQSAYEKRLADAWKTGK